jgi:hypothetical protein
MSFQQVEPSMLITGKEYVITFKDVSPYDDYKIYSGVYNRKNDFCDENLGEIYQYLQDGATIQGNVWGNDCVCYYLTIQNIRHKLM